MTDPAQSRQQWLLAFVAAGATIIGGFIGGSASYFATREANRAVVEREERSELLDAQSAARLVDDELAVVAARLRNMRQPGINHASLVQELRKVPTTAWKANQQRLARTLLSHEWGSVSQAYTLVRMLPAGMDDLA